MTFGLGKVSVLLATALAAAEKACGRVEPRLDRQAQTLGVVWKQCGGCADPRAPCSATRFPPTGWRSTEMS